METPEKIPDGVKPGGEGSRLWVWLLAECEKIESCGPLAIELCRIADRLQQVREKLDAQGLTVSAARGRSAKNPLIDMEVKLSKQYQALWRSLGLSDKNSDDAPRRPVGRPGAGDIWPPPSE